MDDLIQECRAALAAGLYVVGLTSTLALVDICAALQSPNGETTGPKFKRWFTENLSEKYPRFSPDDAYQLRCGVLHQGVLRSRQHSRLIFTLPNRYGIVVHNVQKADEYGLSLMQFCGDVLAAVSSWWDSNKDTEPVQTNAGRVVQLLPNGSNGMVVGLPTMA